MTKRPTAEQVRGWLEFVRSEYPEKIRTPASWMGRLELMYADWLRLENENDELARALREVYARVAEARRPDSDTDEHLAVASQAALKALAQLQVELADIVAFPDAFGSTRAQAVADAATASLTELPYLCAGRGFWIMVSRKGAALYMERIDGSAVDKIHEVYWPDYESPVSHNKPMDYEPFEPARGDCWCDRDASLVHVHDGKDWHQLDPRNLAP